MAGSPAEEYLLSRGLSSETVESFRLGYIDDRSALPEHRHLRGRLAIPYLTKSGVVSMRFRVIPPDEDKAKYKGWQGIPAKCLFNVNDLWTTEPIFICEGEIDAITAHQAGLHAVGVAGVSNWDSNWWRIFRNRTVVILADSDDNGQGVGMAEMIMETVRDSSLVAMPSGHDVNSYVRAAGPEALLALINERLHRD